MANVAATRKGTETMTTWAERLDNLPTITQGHTANLKVETKTLRVWLARTGLDDGEPFAHTVYVETLRNDRWEEVGHYDGDVEDPQPWPVDARLAYLATVEETEGSE